MTFFKIPTHTHTSKNAVLAALLFSLILTTDAIAQGVNEGETHAQRKQRLKDYYVVDLIILKHKDTNLPATEYPEKWPKTIDFTWPEKPLRLMPIHPSSIYPEIGNDLLGLNNATQKKLAVKASISNNYRANRLPLTTNALSALTSEAKKISRVARYELLSQRSWVQKITTKAKPRDIIIPIDIELNNTQDSDDISFNINPNTTYVTGSISLKKSRYLHLSTNLIAVNLLSTPLVSEPASNNTDTIHLSSQEEDSLDKLTLATADIETPEQWPALLLKSRSLEQAYTAKTGLDASKQTPNPLMIPSAYIQQVATLKQKRKMRSKETHYIDHPVIGLVIRITPLMYELDNHQP